MNVIFLDIDGVLNNNETKDRIGTVCGVDNRMIILLKEIVEFLNADIILSSSWREYWNKDLINDNVKNWKGCSEKRYGRYLNFRLGEFGLKITDKTEDIHWTKRPEEINAYLEKHPEIEYFIILDDEEFPWKWYNLENHWIKTSENAPNLFLRDSGLKKEHIDYIKENKEQFRRKNL